jgi:hypothetical protein
MQDRYGCIQLARYTSVLKWNIPFPIKLLRTHLNGTKRTINCEAAICVLACGFFPCVSYVTETKYTEGINWLCPGVVDLSNQTICSEWIGINFANKSPRLRAVAGCAAYLSSSEVGFFMTQQKTCNSNQHGGLVIFIYYVCKYHIIQYVGL